MSVTAVPNSNSATAFELGPVPVREREQSLDLLRGVAIAGILFVNITSLKSPYFFHPVPGERWPGWFDRLAVAFTAFAAEGKFFTLLSFLLGYGVALQFARAEQHATPCRRIHRRRLLTLFLIGLIHAIFIWEGDVLMIYAVLGVPLLWMRRLNPRTLVRCAAMILLVLPFISGTLFWSLRGEEFGLFSDSSTPEYAAAYDAWIAETEQQARHAMSSYRSGNWTRIFEQRLLDLEYLTVSSLATYPQTLAILLLGFGAGKCALLRRRLSRYRRVSRLAGWLAAITILGHLLFLAGRGNYAEIRFGTGSMIGSVGLAFATVAQGLYYGAWLWLLPEHSSLRRTLAALFAPMGRMALTNYLMQSLLCTSLFLGAGLYGRVGPATGLLIAATIILGQIAFSRWWLSRFSSGPMEWLWRRMTYAGCARKSPPLREGAAG